MKTRQLFKELFQSKTCPRGMFIPLMCSFAAKLKQITVREMLHSPSHLSNCQRDALKLFQHDVVINIFDTSLEAEAMGCGVRWEHDHTLPCVVSHPLAGESEIPASDPLFETKGRIPVVLEATKRLTTIVGKQAAVLGVVTGPLTLASHLAGAAFLDGLKHSSSRSQHILELAGSTCLNLSSKYCDLNVDAILFVEETTGISDSQVIDKSGHIYESLINVAHFYEKPVMMLSRCGEFNDIDTLSSLNFDAVISGWANYSSDLNKTGACLGNGVPLDVLLSTPENIRKNLADCFAKTVDRGMPFLATEWDIPYNAPIQNIHEMIKVFKETAA